MTNPSGPPETPTERGDSKRNSSGKPNSWATSSFPLNPRLHNELVYPDSSLEASPCFRLSGRTVARNRASNDAAVSTVPPIFPYGGFSPVRLEGWHLQAIGQRLPSGRVD